MQGIADCHGDGMIGAKIQLCAICFLIFFILSATDAFNDDNGIFISTFGGQGVHKVLEFA